MLKTKEEIEKWLIEFGIINYEINENLTVNVNGQVDLFNKELIDFPFQFGIINGDFYCYKNKLRKELLYFFNSEIKGDIKSDFGDKEEFLKLIELFKNIEKEKKELNKIITPEINSSVIKKRL